MNSNAQRTKFVQPRTTKKQLFFFFIWTVFRKAVFILTHIRLALIYHLFSLFFLNCTHKNGYESMIYHHDIVCSSRPVAKYRKNVCIFHIAIERIV